MKSHQLVSKSLWLCGGGTKLCAQQWILTKLGTHSGLLSTCLQLWCRASQLLFRHWDLQKELMELPAQPCPCTESGTQAHGVLCCSSHCHQCHLCSQHAPLLLFDFNATALAWAVIAPQVSQRAARDIFSFVHCQSCGVVIRSNEVRVVKKS